MSRSKHIDRICAIAGALALIVCLCLMFIELPESAGSEMGYEDRLFSSGRVHSIDIIMEDWDAFIASARSEEYSPCSLVVDGESIGNVAIRGKGNTSLSNVESMGSSRSSFKIEFDHYETGKSYHGLDKLSLNSLIQDASFMKDYLSYTLMGCFGVAAPLCSYVSVSVNGELWGLYLAVEGVEDSFLTRNYGADHGELYKPDSMEIGGGRGQGQEFRMEDFSPEVGGGGGGASSDVLLRYSDEQPESYPNIFGNAKTHVTKADESRLIAALKTLSEGINVEEALDTEAVLRYFVVHNYLVNGDSYTGGMVHNYYLYEDSGLLSMIPWDYNLAFGTFMGGYAQSSVNDSIDSPLSVGSDSRPMIDWIFQSEEYTARYHELFREFLTSVNIPALVEETAELIAPYIKNDPTAFYSYEEFEAGADALERFCTLRSESVLGQLSGSIPSTSEGQRQSPESLVDTGDLNLSAMGTMGGNMGGRPDMGTVPDMGKPPNMGTAPDRGGMPDMGQSPFPGEGWEQGAAPALPGGEMASPQTSFTGPAGGSSFAIMPLCALLLIAGIVIVWRYRRR